MLKKFDLKILLNEAVGKAEIENIAARCSGKSSELVDVLALTLDQNKASAFRAAWLLETILRKHPDLFLVIAEEFYEQYSAQANPSCQRHFTKLLFQTFDLPGVQHLLVRYADSLVEATFLWLTDTSTPVAVKANCLDVLCKFIPQKEWVKEELEEQILFLCRNGTAAVQSRAKNINKFLKRGKHR